MSINNILSYGLAGVLMSASLFCCSCTDDKKDLDPVIEKVEIKAPSYALQREIVRVLTSNVASGYDCIIDFGDGTVTTAKSGIYVEHAYTRPGEYTIKVKADSYLDGRFNINVYEGVGLTETYAQLARPGNKRVLVMSHRAHTTDPTIPENTCQAIDAAIAAGADLMEIDVWTTLDGVLVVTHDPDPICPDGKRRDIRQMYWKDVKEMKIINRAGEFTDATIPTFEEILLYSRGRTLFKIDKTDNNNIADLCKLMDKTGMWEACIFYTSKGEEFIKYNPYVHLGSWQATERNFPGGKQEHYYTEGSYSSNGYVTNLQAGVDAGFYPCFCLLNVLDSGIPEYSIDENQIDAIFRACPQARMIMTDCPGELVKVLEKQGRR